MADSPLSPSPAVGSDAETAGQLRLAEQRLAAHFERTPLAVIEWDHEQRVVAWNAQAERMFGWTAAEVIGRTIRDWRFIHDDDLAAVERDAVEMRAGRVPHRVSVNRNYTKTGGVVWTEWHNSIL